MTTRRRLHGSLVLLSLLGGAAAHASPEQTLRAGKGALNQVAYTRDGKQLVTAGFDKVVRLWDADTGKEVRAYAGARDLVDSVAISPDGQRIVAGSRDGFLTAWKIDGALVFSVATYGGAIWNVRFDRAGKRVVTAS